MSHLDSPSPLYPWLVNYGELPAEVEPVASDMLSLFRITVINNGKREAIRYFNQTMTWYELDRKSSALANRFGDYGINKGDRIGVVLQNTPHAAIAIVAAWKRGAIPVPGNPMYRANELRRMFADYRPSAVVCHNNDAPIVAEALSLAGLSTVVLIGVEAETSFACSVRGIIPKHIEPMAGVECFETIADAKFAEASTQYISLIGSDVGLILYTSGTTGLPKGTVITHASLAFSAANSAAWFGITTESRILGLAPIFHITGFVLHLCLGVSAGCSQAYHYRFDTKIVMEMLRSYRPTFTIAAITAFNALMNHEGITAADFSCFERVYSGGAPIAPSLRASIHKRLGVEIYPVYGMTETTSPTHAAPFGAAVPIDSTSGALSLGIPMSSTGAMIADDLGRAVGLRQPGEILMRGPQVMRGYLNKPADTSSTFIDGWMRSGDVGFMDENGWFYLIDRKKDLINASGFKVWPREVEDVLYAHPAVREVAVIGVPDDYRGETVKAVVSLKMGVTTDAETLGNYCRSLLAAYKVPRIFEFRDELPKTPTGKIQKSALRNNANVQL